MRVGRRARPWHRVGPSGGPRGRAQGDRTRESCSATRPGALEENKFKMKIKKVKINDRARKKGGKKKRKAKKGFSKERHKKAFRRRFFNLTAFKTTNFIIFKILFIKLNSNIAQ